VKRIFPPIIRANLWIEDYETPMLTFKDWTEHLTFIKDGRFLTIGVYVLGIQTEMWTS
jgi:hypothetical protein